MPSSRALPVVALLALLVASVAVRLLVLDVPGHDGDVRIMARWAERMADDGPWRFYEVDGSIYPALLYPLWLLGAAFDGDTLLLAVKGMSVPFDVGVGLLLYGTLRSRAGEGAALLAAGLYLLNPAAILAGPLWGQVDSAGTLAYLAALVALAWPAHPHGDPPGDTDDAVPGRHATAGALATVATMVKPQFGLVVLPVLAVAVLRSRSGRSWGPAGRTLAGMLGAYVVVAGPLRLHPLLYAGLLGDTATRQPSTSLNAFNPWGLLVGFKVPDEPYVGIGTVLLGLGLVGAMLGLRRRPDLAVVLGVGAVLVLAFYFLPTRVHERYLYPAIALLAPFAAAGGMRLLAYVALSLAFAGSLLYALADTTPFALPDPWATWLVSTAGIWAIGLVLITSAVSWAWLLVVRPPRLPGPRDRPVR